MTPAPTLPQQDPVDGFAANIDWAPALVEIAIFAALIYTVIRFVMATRGLVLIRGLGLLLAVLIVGFVLLIQAYELQRLQYVVEQLAPSIVLGLVIVFHPEIRRAIVQIGDSWFFRLVLQRDGRVVPVLRQVVERLSKERTGALIALERDASLGEIAAGGVLIDAELNRYLVESIFYPKSPLHDGGIIVRDDRIVAASCLFPLSQNAELDKRFGTRHRAALGLAEETDAFVIVVSEETGNVAVASGGVLRTEITLDQLEAELAAALGRKRVA